MKNLLCKMSMHDPEMTSYIPLGHGSVWMQETCKTCGMVRQKSGRAGGGLIWTAWSKKS
jgi:hypothetical protein